VADSNSTVSRAETAIRELGTRSLSGVIGNLMMVGATEFIAPNAGTFSRPLVFSTFAVLIGLRYFARGRSMKFPLRRGNAAMMAIAAIGCNTVWGLMIANVQSVNGAGMAAVTYTFYACGIAVGTVVVLAPSAWMQRCALVGVTAPGIIAAIAGHGVPPFAAMHAIFLAYTLVMGAMATRAFWQSVAAQNQMREEIKQRLAIEVELRQAQKLEAVGRLAAGIAHEINTPVQFVTDSCTFLSDGIHCIEAGLAGYRSLLQELLAAPGSTDHVRARAAELELEHDLPYMREHLDAAAARSLAGLERVAKIVRATREFAAPRNADKAPANLNAAIESTLVICGHETHGVDVVTELGAIPLVTCSGGELNQVFLNLIVNAAHAIAEKHEHGTIRIKTWDPGDGYVKIAISDTGGGIPIEILDKIFEPFFTTKPVGKGSGQGLAIARSIVVGKHGGMLDVASQVGVGTTFTIALPA
jgi:signal transduction histidine kinase